MTESELTIGQIVDSMTDVQRDALYLIVGNVVNSEQYPLFGSMAVYQTFTQQQKDVTHFMVGHALNKSKGPPMKIVYSDTDGKFWIVPKETHG